MRGGPGPVATQQQAPRHPEPVGASQSWTHPRCLQPGQAPGWPLSIDPLAGVGGAHEDRGVQPLWSPYTLSQGAKVCG